MQIINLLPHDCVVRLKDGTDKVYPVSGSIARVDTSDPTILGEIDGWELVSTPVYGEVLNLPEKKKDIFYIVSAIVAAALQQQSQYRPDCLVPATGPKDGALRDGRGQIIAVTKLYRATPL